MSSLQRLEANRRNALRSTGPRTEEGKQRSRLNAVRHGLTAETVVGSLEDAEDYKAFEASIISDYSPETAVARELTLRLASLLWRLRRANAIETDLFELHAEALRQRRLTVSSPMAGLDAALDTASESTAYSTNGDVQHSNNAQLADEYKTSIRNLAHTFLRLAKLDSRAFECLSRYEAALWRQTKRTLCALHSSRYRPLQR
jgi:hypothetical protein